MAVAIIGLKVIDPRIYKLVDIPVSLTWDRSSDCKW